MVMCFLSTLDLRLPEKNKYDKLQGRITCATHTFYVPLWSSSNVQIDPTAAGAVYDREFIVCSLDLLSGLAEGLGAGIESLVSSCLCIWYHFPFQVHFRHDHTNTPLTYPHGCVRGGVQLFNHWVQSYYHIGAMLNMYLEEEFAIVKGEL
jgi:hypothetical protein